MKDYLWIIIAGIGALIAFLVFILTLSTSTSLIKRLNRSKANILLNITVLLLGFTNLGLAIYLLQDIRDQISKFGGY